MHVARVIFKVYLNSLFYFYAWSIYINIRTQYMLTTVIPNFVEHQMNSAKAKKDPSEVFAEWNTRKTRVCWTPASNVNFAGVFHGNSVDIWKYLRRVQNTGNTASKWHRRRNNELVSHATWHHSFVVFCSRRNYAQMVPRVMFAEYNIRQKGLRHETSSLMKVTLNVHVVWFLDRC